MALRRFQKVLQQGIQPEDRQWSYHVTGLPKAASSNAQNVIKVISIISNSKEQKIVLRFENAPLNRVIKDNSLDKFAILRFEDFRLRYPANENGTLSQEALPRESVEYVTKLLTAGIVLNGVTYNFFGHSNSQLKSKSCFLFADSKENLSGKIASMGDFSGCKTVAKKSKRIGLLFSSIEGGIQLDPTHYEDVPDIETMDYNFTDGCGLISPFLARRLVKDVRIHFRNKRYTPSVFQIRYRGYKGVLTLEPDLGNDIWAKFRKSMKKFSDAKDLTLSVVEYSKPYTYGFLNDEIILLLSALGVPMETFLRKQSEHIEFLKKVELLEPQSAFRFLAQVDHYDQAERVLLDGVESVASSIRKYVSAEYASMLNKRDEQRCRIFMLKSRLLFGVCDPRGVLNPGECFVRITLDGDGQPRTLANTDVLVTRNPCLHPGDVQKLRAVERKELSHLHDCIVFPTRGRRPPADMLSGGDLDGDKFFVCWDTDIIPRVISEAAIYPPPPDPPVFRPVSDQDRLEYFARYTNASLGRAKALYLSWARHKGSMSSECQELNRLFSQCVDGKTIKIPPRLQEPPKGPLPEPGFILDVLHDHATEQLKSRPLSTFDCTGLSFDAMKLLLSRDCMAVAEIELVKLAFKWCRQNKTDLLDFLDYFDVNLLSDDEKHWLLSNLPPQKQLPSLILNGLLSSCLVDAAELRPFGLCSARLHWKQVFNSSTDRMGIFLDRVSSISEDFHKKFLLFNIDDRLTVGVFIPVKIEKHTECTVDTRVRVFVFPHTKESSQNFFRRVVPTKVNYRLYCDESTFQLYEDKRANTWIFLTRSAFDDSKYRNISYQGDRRRQQQTTIVAGANFDCRASIALQKISRDVQKHIGRVNRTSVRDAEIYVISNRDVGSLKALDLWLDLVDTQEVLRLFDEEPVDYSLPTIKDIDWTTLSRHIKAAVIDKQLDSLLQIESPDELQRGIAALAHIGARTKIRSVYDWLLNNLTDLPLDGKNKELGNALLQSLVHVPFLISPFFKSPFFERYEDMLRDDMVNKGPELLKSLILAGNTLEYFVVEPFELVLSKLPQISQNTLVDLVELIALTIPSTELALDLLLGSIDLHSPRVLVGRPTSNRHLVKNLNSIAVDYVEAARSEARVEKDLVRLNLKVYKGADAICEVNVRIDSEGISKLRSGDHLTLRPKNPEENALSRVRVCVDALVEGVELGRVSLRCLHHPPSYFQNCSWTITNCGSFTTTKAMFEAVRALHTEPEICCQISDILLAQSSSAVATPEQAGVQIDNALNYSQNKALEASVQNSCSIIWGPPGTGKTYTIVAILKRILTLSNGRVLCTAPTHNAVDNILRRFVKEKAGITPLRVSTDIRRVSDDLKQYTCDALVNGDQTSTSASYRAAQKRVKEARIIFSTCASSGLGLLRPETFQIVLIDEASQQSEAAALIPLVKGCEQAILVGDHVQLRATVQQQSKQLDFDVSLFERLYTGPDQARMAKTLLNTQYRMHRELCTFSSAEFYDNKLMTAVKDDERPLPLSLFAWPLGTSGSNRCRKLFFQLAEPEDLGRKSKSNRGQALLCEKICTQLLTKPTSDGGSSQSDRGSWSLAILTPYKKQAELLKRMLPEIEVSSIDGYQGKEADIVVLVTVRCNYRGEIGFLTDMRRLNVALTRAKTGLIVIGDKETLIGSDDAASSATWHRLISSCQTIPGSEFMKATSNEATASN